VINNPNIGPWFASGEKTIGPTNPHTKPTIPRTSAHFLVDFRMLRNVRSSQRDRRWDPSIRTRMPERPKESRRS
jgi:hypothetical protein